MRTIVLAIVVAVSVALLSTALIEAQPLAQEELLSSMMQQDEPQAKDSASKEDTSEETKNHGKAKREAAVYLTQGGGPYSPNSIRVMSRKEYRNLPNGNIAVEKSYYFMNGTKVPPSMMEGTVILDSSSQESSSEERVMRVIGKREADPQGMMKQANPGMYGYPGRLGGGGIIVDSSSQGVSSSEERRAMWLRGKREVEEPLEELEEPEALVRLERSPKKKGHGSSSSLYSQLYGN